MKIGTTPKEISGNFLIFVLFLLRFQTTQQRIILVFPFRSMDKFKKKFQETFNTTKRDVNYMIKHKQFKIAKNAEDPEYVAGRSASRP